MLKDPPLSAAAVRLVLVSIFKYFPLTDFTIFHFHTFFFFSFFLAAGHGPKLKRFSFTYCSFTQPQLRCFCYSSPSVVHRAHFPIAAQWQLMCKTLIRFVKCAPANCRLDFPRKMLSNCCHKTLLAFLFESEAA